MKPLLCLVLALTIPAADNSSATDDDVDVKAAVVEIKVEGTDYNDKAVPTSWGTGFFARDDGTIVTAAHVVKANKFWKGGAEGPGGPESHPDRRITVYVLGRDGKIPYLGEAVVLTVDDRPAFDTAVIQIGSSKSGAYRTVVPLAGRPKESQAVHLLGYGTDGNDGEKAELRPVSGKLDNLHEARVGGYQISTSVPVEGDSGAPVFEDKSNQVIGMVSLVGKTTIVIPIERVAQHVPGGFKSQSAVGQEREQGGAAMTNTLTKDEDAIVRALGLKYIIQSATMQIGLSHTGDERSARINTTYSLLAVADIAAQERIFVEDYHSNSGGRLEYRPGTEAQHPMEDGEYRKQFWVPLSMKAGEVRTILTGVDARYTLPFPPARSSHLYKDLGSNEDAWCYPNWMPGDVIREFRFVIRSEDRPMRACRRQPSAKRAGQVQGQLLETTADEHDGDSEVRGAKGWLATARWTDLAPNEIVCMCVEFPDGAAQQ